MATNVFVSCGSVATDAQENFVRAIEEHFERYGLRPLTIGRNVFDHGQPLKLIDKVMRRCAGAAIIAYERVHIVDGQERRGSPREAPLRLQNTATPWNQIEAALAYALRLPLFVVVEAGLRQDGLLESGYDWRVVNMGLDEAPSAHTVFDATFRSWRKEVSRTVWRKGFATQFPVGERVQNRPIATSEAATT